MIDKRFDAIEFSTSNYNGDNDKMFEAINAVIRVLLDGQYIVVVRYDEPGLGVVIVEFGHDDRLDYWGVPNPMWLTPEEMELHERDREGD